MFLKIFHIYACKSSLFIFTDEHSGGLVAKSCPTLLLPHGPQPTRLLCTVSLYEKSWLIYFPNEWQLGFLFVCLFLPWTSSSAVIIFAYVSMRTNFSREDLEKNNLWLREYAYLKFYFFDIVVVQSLSHVQLFVTPWAAAHQASLSFPISQSLLKFMSIESVIPSNNLILCCPLLSLPSIFPINRVFSNESALCIKWPKYWSFSFSLSPFNEYSGLISFKIGWIDLLAVQGTLKNLLQYHNLKASALQSSPFFVVQSFSNCSPK